MTGHMLRLAPLLVVALTGPAAAEDHCVGHDNCLGVYFDAPVFEENCNTYIPAFSPFHFYFVLKSCSLTAIGGFEFAWLLAPSPGAYMVILGFELPPGASAVPDPYNVIVQLSDPLTVNGPCVLSDAKVMFFAPTNRTGIWVGPSTPASLPGHAVVMDAGDPPAVVPLFVGEFALPTG